MSKEGIFHQIENVNKEIEKSFTEVMDENFKHWKKSLLYLFKKLNELQVG